MNEFLIFGYGVSGKAAAKLLEHQHPDSKIWVIDQRLLQLSGNLGQCTLKESKTKKLKAVVVSPGYKLDPNELEFIKDKDWLSEFEFGLMHLKPKSVIAVTGTNGKSSVVKMLEHTLNQAGIHAIAAGNIGTPTSTLAALNEHSNMVVILEVSSYQLSYLKKFMFDWSIITNITSDHLEWHGSLKHYQNSKSKLAVHTKNACIVSSQALESFAPNTVNAEMISLENPSNSDLVEKLVMNAFPRHSNRTAEHLSTYKGLKHRLEKICLNPLVINDSKATNIDATCYALSSMKQPVILLFGGKPKDGDCVKKLTKHRPSIQVVVLFGPLGAQSLEFFKTLGVDVHFFKTLKECLAPQNQELWLDSQLATLFSPGGSSFDEFQSFEDRGQFFVQALNL